MPSRRELLPSQPRSTGAFVRTGGEGPNSAPRRHWTYGFFAVLALIAGAMAGMSTAQAATPAETYIQQNIDRGYTILNNTGLSQDARRSQFRDFMLGLTDMRRIAQFTLGQYANSASKAELDEYATAFGEYAISVYESRLGKYKGQTLKVTGSVERAADDIVVNADVVDPAKTGAQPIKAAFRVRKTSDGRSIVTDMQVEGIWLAISQRSDFTSFLQQNGGKVPTLTAHLRQQTDKIRSGAPVN